jgi:hypothetical protein
MGYYLADGIYPQWATFVKTISKPRGNKKNSLCTRSRILKKDVERAFKVLQARWGIVRGPARFWNQKTLWYIMTACIIMHNMILEDEQGQDVDYIYETTKHDLTPMQPQKDKGRIYNSLEVHRQINNREGHNQLQEDLV